MIRQRIYLSGQVQGVGLRYRARHAADMCHITGYAKNNIDGTVEIEAQGEPEDINRFLSVVGSGTYIQITDIRRKEIPPVSDERCFGIRGY